MTPNQLFITGLHNLGVYSDKSGNLCTELHQVLFNLIFCQHIQLLFPKSKVKSIEGKLLIVPITQPGTLSMPLEPETITAPHLRTPSYRCPVSPEINTQIENMFPPRLINKGNAREVYLILRRLVNAITGATSSA
jgi:hypothetical protein